MENGKADLRAAALAKRDMISPSIRAAFASRLATSGLRIVHDYAPHSGTLVVGLFSPIGSEPDLGLLAEALSGADVPTALPVTGKRDSPLVFRRWTAGDPVALGSMKIDEPLASAAEVEPDVLFVPVAVFDRRCHRIGYGAGYYDRTLAALRARKSIRAIGVAYSVQEELFVPAEPHDEPLDLILTERETFLHDG